MYQPTSSVHPDWELLDASRGEVRAFMILFSKINSEGGGGHLSSSSIISIRVMRLFVEVERTSRLAYNAPLRTTQILLRLIELDKALRCGPRVSRRHLGHSVAPQDGSDAILQS